MRDMAVMCGRTCSWLNVYLSDCAWVSATSVVFRISVVARPSITCKIAMLCAMWMANGCIADATGEVERVGECTIVLGLFVGADGAFGDGDGFEVGLNHWARGPLWAVVAAGF